MRRKTTEKWIEEAIDVHGDKYVYTNSKYTNNKSKLTIECRVHGEFSQQASSHLKGNGCPKCAGQFTYTTASIIEASKNKYGEDTLLYDKVKKAGNSKSSIILGCPEHGYFTQEIKYHLNSAVGGCPKCSYASANKDKTLIMSEFLDKAEAVHGSKYDYSKVKFRTVADKVDILCTVCGTIFNQRVAGHLEGKGCSTCGIGGGFKDTLPGILYYLRVKVGNTVAYKIGITNKSVKSRYSNAELENITVLQEWKYSYGKNARIEEQRILKEYKPYKYTGIDLLVKGNTELFAKDVLELDVEGDLDER